MADQLLTGTTLVESTSRSDGDAPVGSIISWAKSFTGVPSLPQGWLECNGQVVNDPLSSLNGQTLPDLNGDNRFMRGDSTSGGTGGSATMAHTHVGNTSTSGAAIGGGPPYGFDVDIDTGQITGVASNTENRPPYYNVVWIMRIR